MDEEDGPLVFQHACKLGLEGIVSKRCESFYSSGRSPLLEESHTDQPRRSRRPLPKWLHGTYTKNHREIMPTNRRSIVIINIASCIGLTPSWVVAIRYLHEHSSNCKPDALRVSVQVKRRLRRFKKNICEVAHNVGSRSLAA
jgi:hypothetical protein